MLGYDFDLHYKMKNKRKEGRRRKEGEEGTAPQEAAVCWGRWYLEGMSVNRKMRSARGRLEVDGR